MMIDDDKVMIDHGAMIMDDHCNQGW